MPAKPLDCYREVGMYAAPPGVELFLWNILPLADED
jgi:hypothetical protein